MTLPAFPFRFSVLTGVRRFLGAAMLSATLGGAEPTFRGPLTSGTLAGPPRQETSGLALSRATPNLVWTHDDSKGTPILYAADLVTGKRRGAIRVTGTQNEDWEDIASFTLDGKAWLMVGDVGDNDAERTTVQLHVLAEPAADRLKPGVVVDVQPAYTIRFRYSDGPRDCESVAVDASEGTVYLLTKRDSPPRLYQLPLANPGQRVVEARLVGPVPGIVGKAPADGLIKRIAGKRFSWPTAMDFAADGRAAAVLTYGEPLIFPRAEGETWAMAFARPPIRLLFHGLPQAEAISFSADGRSVYVASESVESLIRYDREDR